MHSWSIDAQVTYHRLPFLFVLRRLDSLPLLRLPEGARQLIDKVLALWIAALIVKFQGREGMEGVGSGRISGAGMVGTGCCWCRHGLGAAACGFACRRLRANCVSLAESFIEENSLERSFPCLCNRASLRRSSSLSLSRSPRRAVLSSRSSLLSFRSSLLSWRRPRMSSRRP